MIYFPTRYPKTFKQAQFWRKTIFNFIDESFPDVEKRILIKRDPEEFFLIIYCSSEKAKKALLKERLIAKVEFKPWYGTSDFV
jgi:hypothetical protein